MREHRRGREGELATSSVSSARRTEREAAQRQPIDELAAKVKVGNDALATAETCLSSLHAAQLRDDDKRTARERRAVYDGAERTATAKIAVAEEARAGCVEYAAAHQLDAAMTLAVFDTKLRALQRQLENAPPAPPRFERVSAEAEIEMVATARRRGIEERGEQAADLAELFASLNPRDRLVLRDRIAAREPDDRIAQAFTVITEHRALLLGVLAGTRRVRIDPRRRRSRPIAVASREAREATRGSEPVPQHNGTAPTASEVPKTSPSAETKANANATTVAAHGSSTPLPPGTARAAAPVQLSAAPRTPAIRLDKVADAEELRRYVTAGAEDAVLNVLERNAHAEHMYALHHAYGPHFILDMRTLFRVERNPVGQRAGAAVGADQIRLPNGSPGWLRARVYLGDQLALDQQIATRLTRDEVFRDLERTPDHRALELLAGQTVPISVGPTHDTPAPTTIEQVQQALRDRLDDDGYYAAMQMLLSKADRALALVRQLGSASVHGIDVGGAVLRLDGVADVNPVWFDLDPVAKARVDLAEHRIRAADAAGDWSQQRDPEAKAWLAIADLNRAEREALALRLHDRPLNNTRGGMLAERALAMDDATVIKGAIENAHAIAVISRQAKLGIGLATAIARAGELIRAARRKIAALPADAPQVERAAAEAELTRLTEMFLRADSSVLAALRAMEPDALVDNLQALGADPLTIATERLRQVARNDVPGLIMALQQIAPEHRLSAMDHSGKRDEMNPYHSQFWNLTVEQRSLIAAYLQQGSKLELILVEAATASAPPDEPPPYPVGMAPTLANPVVEIALHDVLTGMDRGPSAAHAVLARLDRMKPDDCRQLVSDARFLMKLDRMPKDTDEEFNFRFALRTAATESPAAAIAKYPKSQDADSAAHKVQLEALRQTAEREGRAHLRRGYVLLEQVKRDTGIADLHSLEAAIDPRRYPRPGDYAAIRKVLSIQKELEQQRASTETRAQAAEILYGAPQLIDSADGALDPNIEADFMYGRLGDLVGDKQHKLQEVETQSGRVAEALATFGTLYDRVRPGGISRTELAELAVEYHRATREFEQYKQLKAENESLARIATLVAGVVTALVVTAATGGTLGPVALSALAAISAGTASAIAGAAIRWEDTAGTVFKDFGTGAVEGAASIAGAALAARVVRGASAGVAAGQAAAKAGGAAVGRATGGLGSTIAENAIDGAIGGMAGDLFQTAIDEATWDRGVGEGMAKLLVATARGAALGVAFGGGIGGLVGGLAKIAARSGTEAAHGVGRLLDASGVERAAVDPLSDAARDQLAHAHALVEAGKLDEAEKVLRAIHELPSASRTLMVAAARARAALAPSTELAPIELAGEQVWPRIIDDEEFFKRAGDRRAYAMVELRDGKPEIIARKSAPPSAIREEVIHVYQFHSDILMRRRIEGLASADWASASGEQKLALHIDKLEVEADAQRRIRDGLAAQAEDDPEAALRVLDAEETLFLISQRLDKLYAARGLPSIDVKALGIEHAPQLFARGAQTTRLDGWRAERVYLELIGKDPNDPAVVKRLQQLGYQKPAVMDGKVTRINRREPFANELPHIKVNEDTGLIELARPRKYFGALHDDAGRRWRTEQHELKGLEHELAAGTLTGADAVAAHAHLAGAGMGFRKLLEEQAVLGNLDEGSAGLLARWAPTIELLESQTRHLDPALRITAADIFAHVSVAHGKTMRKVEADEFRRYLRERTAAYLISIEDPVQRTDALYQMIAAQPDAASGGHLFTAFRRRLMADGEDAGTYVVPDKHPAARFEGDDLDKTRQPDDVVDIKHRVEGALPGGKYAIEDKTGANAFQIKQAEDYARRSDANLVRRADGDHDYGVTTGGFKRTKDGTTSEYDGLVYVFSRMEEAEAALRKMSNNNLVGPLLGQHPGGVHVMAIDKQGRLKTVTALPTKRADDV